MRRPLRLMKVPMKRWLVRIAVLLLVLVAALVITIVVADEAPPTGKAGPFADLLARRMQGAVEMDRWNATGIVRFDFGGRFQHVWDRNRRYARIRWGETEVLMRLDDRSGIARVKGEVVEGDAAKAALEEANVRFVNDTFWLNPMATFFNEGVTREIVELEGNKQALLVSYGSGGVTPGDKYLFFHDGRWKPNRWKMWVDIIPVGGLAVTWERYQTLQTGAQISTKHDWLIPFEIEGLAGANDVSMMFEEDPFAELGAPKNPASQPAHPAAPASQPSSQPAPE